MHKGDGVFAIHGEDLERLKPYVGERFIIDVARRRNVGFHRKVFNFFRDVHANQDQFPDIDTETFRKWMTMEAGEAVVYVAGNKQWAEAKSLAFDKMTQTDFDNLFKRLVTVAVEKLGLDWARHYE